MTTQTSCEAERFTRRGGSAWLETCLESASSHKFAHTSLLFLTYVLNFILLDIMPYLGSEDLKFSRLILEATQPWSSSI